jgi:hypothetical protein
MIPEFWESYFSQRMGETDVHVERSKYLTFAVITTLTAPKNAESTGKRREGQCMLVVGHGKYPWPKECIRYRTGTAQVCKTYWRAPQSYIDRDVFVARSISKEGVR